MNPLIEVEVILSSNKMADPRAKTTILSFRLRAVIFGCVCFLVAVLAITVAFRSSKRGDPASTMGGVPASQPVIERAIADIQQHVTSHIENSEEVQVAKFKLGLQSQLANGWRPPWKSLEVDLSDEQIKETPTTILGAKLLSTGIPARELMIFDNPSFAMVRLELCYKGFAELFNRPDLASGIATALDASSYLNRGLGEQENLNIIMVLNSVPSMYTYGPVKKNLKGHEREIVKAHRRALINIGQFASRQIGQPSTAAKITPNTAINLCMAALSQAAVFSPESAQRGKKTLLQFQWTSGDEASDIPKYTNEAAAVLDKF